MMFKVWSYNPVRCQFTGAFQTADTLPAGFYHVGTTQYGEPTATELAPREDELICFSSGPMPEVFREMDQFWGSKLRYKTMGVTHKRGILLHGPAGCGKTGIVNFSIKDTIKRNGIAVPAAIFSAPSLLCTMLCRRAIQPQCCFIPALEMLISQNILEDPKPSDVAVPSPDEPTLL